MEFSKSGGFDRIPAGCAVAKPHTATHANIQHQQLFTIMGTTYDVGIRFSQDYGLASISVG
jgi:hypothetical protein